MTVIRDRIRSTSGGRTEPPVLRRPAVYVVAAATVAALGFNWPIMSEGVAVMPAMWLAAFRLAGAALLVAAVMATRGGIHRPPREDMPIVLSVGLMRLAFVTSAVFIALRFVPPGRSAILVYTSSLWVVPMAVVVLGERLTGLRGTGLALGCLGLVTLLEPWSLDWSDERLLVGFGLLLAAAVASAATSVHVRGHRWRSTPLALMPWQLGLAAIPITVLAILVDGSPRITWTPSSIAIVAYQIVFGSALGVWGVLTMLRSMPAISVNLTLMAVPVVGLVSSFILVDEPASASVIVSLVLVLLGVGLGLWSDRRQAEEVVALPP